MNVHVIVDAKAGDTPPDADTVLRSVQQVAAFPEGTDFHVVINTREATSTFKSEPVVDDEPEA